MKSKTHIILSTFTTGLMILSCIGGGQKKSGSEESIEPLVDSVKIEAYQKYQELISAVDSNICAWGEENYFDIPKAELPRKAKRWRHYAERSETLAREAAELISPYDSTLLYFTTKVIDTSNTGLFYTNMYLTGGVEGFADKSLIECSFAWTFVQDIKWKLEHIQQ